VLTTGYSARDRLRTLDINTGMCECKSKDFPPETAPGKGSARIGKTCVTGGKGGGGNLGLDKGKGLGRGGGGRTKEISGKRACGT